MTQPQSKFDPGFAAFGGGAASSILHPAVMVAVIVLSVLTFCLPRRQIIVPLLLGIMLIPTGQNLNIGGVHLYIYRLLILVGWVRVLSSTLSPAKFFFRGLSTLDKVFLVWAIYRAMSVVILFEQVGAAVNQGAFLLDSLGGYFLFRFLIRDTKDVQRVVATFAVVTLVCAVDMLIELKTGQNMFGLLGGIRLVSDVRMGRIRAQGAFQHSILAGSFAATVFPLFLWLWKSRKIKLVAIAGAVSSSIMIVACASSTPISAWLGSLLVICLWPIRSKMRMVRWGIVAAVIALQMAMKAPIWYVLSRIDFAGGSSGWERAFLIDTFTRHIGDWWLIGTHNNATWGWDMWDQCNQYVSEGETGGLIALSCFITMIVIGFRRVGNARIAVAGNCRKEWLFWLIGATVFAHVVAFMGVDYFDQSKFGWYMLLAIIPVATAIPRASVARNANANRLSGHAYTISVKENWDTTLEDPTTPTLARHRVV